MKKAVAAVLVVVMMLAFGATAFAAQGPLSPEQARKVALDYTGVRASEAYFAKVHKDWDNGRQVYEIEFYANNTEYDMDVDVNTGDVTDFSREYHGGYSQSESYGGYYDYDDDWNNRYNRYDDWDDRYDFDLDDLFDWDD